MKSGGRRALPKVAIKNTNFIAGVKNGMEFNVKTYKLSKWAKVQKDQARIINWEVIHYLSTGGKRFGCYVLESLVSRQAHS